MKIDAIKFATSIKVGKFGDQIESVIERETGHHSCTFDPATKLFTVTDKRDPAKVCHVFPTNVAWFCPIENGN